MTSRTRGPGLQVHPLVNEMSDVDRDALHVLPLSLIPLRTASLTRAKMIKNVHLESVIELYQDTRTGSGQLEIAELPRAFGWPRTPVHPDLAVLSKLARLPTFDMYSLRILLRELGVPINDYGALRLSRRKNKELTTYMTKFTRPLIQQLYGEDGVSIHSFEDLITCFRNPDVKQALARLKIIAGRLRIEMNQVPRFLEDYGDVFLSIAYYRNAFDAIKPLAADFVDSLTRLREHPQLRKNFALMKAMTEIEDVISRIMVELRSRFATFDEITADLWTNISAQHFRGAQHQISRSHTWIGGVLCGLNVKMDAWHKAFPNKDGGGPMARSDFLVAQIRPAFDRIPMAEVADNA